MLRPRLRFWAFLDLVFALRFVPDLALEGAFRAVVFFFDLFLGAGAARSSSVTDLTALDLPGAFLKRGSTRFLGFLRKIIGPHHRYTLPIGGDMTLNYGHLRGR